MKVDYNAAYLARMENSVLNRIELDLGLTRQIVDLKTTGLILPKELSAWAARVAAGIKKSSVRTVLDVGCGLGVFGRYVSNINKSTLIGIDTSKLAVRAAQMATPLDENASFIVCSANNTKIPANSIGSIIALDVIHIIEDPNALFDEMARLLAKGGNLTATIYTSKEKSPDAWIKALDQSGFQHINMTDITKCWRNWMSRRHKLRIERYDELKTDLGEEVAAGYLALSHRLIGNNKIPGTLSSISRWWIEADL